MLGRGGAAAIAVALAWLGTSGATRAADIHVSPGQLIEDAVELASPGDTIWLAPGEYHESVYIDRGPLTITSTDGPEVTIVYPQPDHLYGFTAVYANEVTISGLTIRGTDYGGVGAPCGLGSSSFGIRFTHSSGTIENCDLDLFTGPDPDDACFEAGIYNDIISVPARSYVLTVRQCTIRGFLRIGMVAYGSAVVSGQRRRAVLNAYQNRIEGIGSTRAVAQYGAQLGGGARCDLVGNVFLHHSFDGTTFAAGVLIYDGDAAGSRVAWNSFGANQSAVICEQTQVGGAALCNPLLPAPSNWWGHVTGPGGTSAGEGEGQYGTQPAGWLPVVTAYSVATGVSHSMASDEGVLRGARMLDAGMLYPSAPASLEFPLGWIEYVAEGLPFGGSPELTLTSAAALPTPLGAWEYSIDAAHPEPWWHDLPVSDDDGDAVLRWGFGTFGEFGNEEPRWVGVGGPATSRIPVIVEAVPDGPNGRVTIGWTAVPGHRYLVERTPTPNVSWTVIATVTAAEPRAYHTDANLPAGELALFYRVADIGPAM